MAIAKLKIEPVIKVYYWPHPMVRIAKSNNWNCYKPGSWLKLRLSKVEEVVGYRYFIGDVEFKLEDI